ncbi:uncharacterized protein [Haliotis asinina]|uniref:uncharacterized protein isoform X2 n=1 Tax=Haliotis asinina TaxID=109174 RepID=UPI0035325F05
MISFIHRLIVVITFVSVHCEGNVRMLSFTEVVEVREKIQTVSASQTVGQVSRTQCSSLCISSNTCVSFFYVGETKTCHLHDVVFPVAAVSTSSPSTRYYIPSCDESTPPFSNITQLSLNGEENMRYFCGHPGDLTELACASSGHVVIYACRKPTSCADIRNFTSKPVDGHYWLYPPGLGGQDQARIYCHNMGTTPEEFVSLPVPNSGVYPEEELVPCSGPKRYSVIGNQWGSWTYNKIKIDLKLSWKSIGWMPWTIFSRENNGLVVNLNCGGYCGGCSPDGVLTLQSYKPDEPSVSAATLLPIVYEVVQKVP